MCAYTNTQSKRESERECQENTENIKPRKNQVKICSQMLIIQIKYMQYMYLFCLGNQGEGKGTE